MKHPKLFQLVEKVYKNSDQEFGRWMWGNHLQVVAKKAQELSQKHGANEDLAVAGALLHDFGDAFVDRHASDHEKTSQGQATKALKYCGYSDLESEEIIDEVIKHHSCREGYLPRTLEGEILATADAWAHLSTDFYLQFAWKHLPDGKSYSEYLLWVNEKLDRDYNNKIFFEEVKTELKSRYQALKEVFGTPIL